MKTKIILLTICLQLFTISYSFGWGRKGHDIVVEIASRHLTPEAQKAIDELLDNRPVVYYSAWMDEIRSLPEFKFTSPWHYINVDRGEVYTPTAITEGGDVYTIVEESISKLKDHRNLDDSTHRFYFRALIHFVGDMHCPMHAGQKVDRGGGKYKITWFDEETSLHGIWDSGLIDALRIWSYLEWATNIDYLDENYYYNKYCTSSPREWMDETIEAAQQVYAGTREDGDYSSWDPVGEYKHRFSPMLEEQLLKAGIRLASILNDIY